MNRNNFSASSYYNSDYWHPKKSVEQEIEELQYMIALCSYTRLQGKC